MSNLIPCLLLKNVSQSWTFLVYFHFSETICCFQLHEYCQVHKVIIVVFEMNMTASGKPLPEISTDVFYKPWCKAF